MDSGFGFFGLGFGQRRRRFRATTGFGAWLFGFLALALAFTSTRDKLNSQLWGLDGLQTGYRLSREVEEAFEGRERREASSCSTLPREQSQRELEKGQGCSLILMITAIASESRNQRCNLFSGDLFASIPIIQTHCYNRKKERKRTENKRY